MLRGTDPPAKRREVRKLIDAILMTNADLDAFCVDFFPEIRKRMSGNSDRIEKVNLIIELHTPEEILERLMKAHPDEVSRHYLRLRTLPLIEKIEESSLTPRKGEIKSTSSHDLNADHVRHSFSWLLYPIVGISCLTSIVLFNERQRIRSNVQNNDDREANQISQGRSMFHPVPHDELHSLDTKQMPLVLQPTTPVGMTAPTKPLTAPAANTSNQSIVLKKPPLEKRPEISAQGAGYHSSHGRSDSMTRSGPIVIKNTCTRQTITEMKIKYYDSSKQTIVDVSSVAFESGKIMLGKAVRLNQSTTNRSTIHWLAFNQSGHIINPKEARFVKTDFVGRQEEMIESHMDWDSQESKWNLKICEVE